MDNNSVQVPEIEHTSHSIDSFINTNLYNLIADKINEHENRISGCLRCGCEFTKKTPVDSRAIIEAKCSGNQSILYCEVPRHLDHQLCEGDLIVIDCEESKEVAFIRIAGDEVVKIKRQIQGLYGENIPRILRIANQDDVAILKKNKNDEERAKEIFKQKQLKYNLSMKLVDVHYQFDRNKLFFYYTSENRVDFRELARDLASEFRTRIELRQIGVRDEAKRVGGLGTCGREFCCSAFLGNFKRISTHLASEQNLASNFSKLSGPCGKLKCCLSFEVEHNISDLLHSETTAG